MSLLEASYLVFLLQPCHVNLNKRIVKQPKLYFFDSGLLCALLRLQDQGQIAQHHLRGGIFESFVVSELVKARWASGNTGLTSRCRGWADGHPARAARGRGLSVGGAAALPWPA